MRSRRWVRRRVPIAAATVIALASLVLAGCGADGERSSATGPAVAPAARASGAADGPPLPALHPAVDAMAAGSVTITTARGERVDLAVRVARTAEERQQGLQRVAELPAGVGMLFDFGGEDRWGGFWMKDTLVPLDIAFVGADGRIVAVAGMVPCTADPCPVTDPGVPYRVALEVGAGALAASGVAPGDRVTWTLDAVG